MYFAFLIASLNLFRWMLCAANCMATRSSLRRAAAQDKVSSSSANSMKLTANSGFTRHRALRVSGLVLILVLSVGGQGRSQEANIGLPHASAEAIFSGGETALSTSSKYSEVSNYFMDFAGDHSLDAATVIEQGFGDYAKYTVQLRLASGAKQSIVVAAPPGGLRIEMQDMTGDKVPNDLVLRPALLQWLPTVLLNDGHDHFAVIESGTAQGCFTSAQEFAPSGSDGRGTVALMSSGFKAHALLKHGGLPLSRMTVEFVRPRTESVTKDIDHASSSERAPPALSFTA
jgi:hypothetical protein